MFMPVITRELFLYQLRNHSVVLTEGESIMFFVFFDKNPFD